MTSHVHSIDGEIQTWRAILNIVVSVDFYDETGNINFSTLNHVNGQRAK